VGGKKRLGVTLAQKGENGKEKDVLVVMKRYAAPPTPFLINGA